MARLLGHALLGPCKRAFEDIARLSCGVEPWEDRIANRNIQIQRITVVVFGPLVIQQVLDLCFQINRRHHSGSAPHNQECTVSGIGHHGVLGHQGAADGIRHFTQGIGEFVGRRPCMNGVDPMDFHSLHLRSGKPRLGQLQQVVAQSIIADQPGKACDRKALGQALLCIYGKRVLRCIGTVGVPDLLCDAQPRAEL